MNKNIQIKSCACDIDFILQIRILEELQINPLVVVSEKIEIETKELGKFIDFLSQIEIKEDR